MRLHLLDPTTDFSIGIQSICRKFRLHTPILYGVTTNSLILVVDGSPENKICAFLTDKLNGKNVISIAKPTFIGSSIFDYLSIYFVENINQILIIIDKDSTSLDVLKDVIIEKFGNGGITIENNTTISENVLKLIVTKGARTYEIIIVLNGIDEIETEKHTIEDHLLKIGDIECKINSKETWKKLSKDSQERIFDELKNKSKKEVIKFFPQHIQAFNLLSNNDEQTRKY